MTKRKKSVAQPFGFAESRRGMDAFQDTFSYEAQMRATTEGRRSEALRHKGQQLVALGDQDGAHKLFIEAASQHAAHDDGAAAAACWFDLGKSFKDLRTGVRSQNLQEAERLLRLAEASPARRADVRRHILSLDGLGQVLRAIALEFPGAGEARTEALGHFRKAVDLARAHGIATLDLLANVLTNLGNALEQAERFDEAIRAHEESIRLVVWIEREAPPLEDMMTVGLRVSSRRMNHVAALARRGRRTDLKLALERIDVIVHEHDPEVRARAHLAGYEIARRLKGSHGERARGYLDRVDVRRLRPEEQRKYLTALAGEGDLERAVAIARRGAADALEERREARADADADRCAAEAQRFSRRAAELLTEANRPVQAFLALENTAAMRYFDGVARYSWAPSTQVLRVLAELHLRAQELSVVLDDRALRIAGLDPVEHEEPLRQIFDAIRTTHRSAEPADFDWEGSAANLDDVLARARASSSPSSGLRAASDSLRDVAVAIAEEMVRLDPSWAGSRLWSDTVTEASLEGVFSEHPGAVLLRLSIEVDSLLAIAVWKHGSRIEGAAEIFSIPSGTVHALFELTREDPALEPAEKTRAEATLEALLLSLDLGRLLPVGTSHVVILPSLVASFVPWAASGPPGRTLIDLVDSVSYLPNITPLLMRQAPLAQRSGSLLVVPGEYPRGAPTQFHGLAFTEPGNAEIRLFGVAATKEATLSHAASADLVTFYAHGKYGETSATGGIQLADGELVPLEHRAVWRGVERVELWACRSGVNLSYDPLTPWVDEAFGLDAFLHHLGVRSTIGTFWNVPDLVTALLVREYRRGLASGRSAPAALADAQRWWRAEGLKRARSALESDAPARHLQDLAASLGADAEAAAALALGVLGPVASTGARLPPESLDATIHSFSSPTAWAGFRFLGVFDRRPVGAAPPEMRPLTAEERATVEQTLARRTSPDIDDDFDSQLAAATTIGRESPSAAQAITAARLYATRRRSSRAHNLVRGLAWLHEALAAPSLEVAERTQLQREAAWLWCELAIGETPLGIRHLRPMDPHLLERAATAVAVLPDGADRTVLELALAMCRSGELTEVHALNAAAWEQTRPHPVAALEGVRLRTMLVSLVLANQLATPRALAAELVSELGSAPPSDDVALRWRARYAVTIAQLVSRRGLEDLPIPSISSAHFLPHALFLDRCVLAAQAAATHDDLPEGVMRDIVSSDLSLLEADFWGYRRDGGVPAWRATGSPGVGWQRFTGALFAQSFELPQAQLDGARYFIASVHLGADLRVAPLAAMAVLQGLLPPEQRPVELSVLLEGRERHLNVLVDAAASGQFASASDGFARTRAQVAAAVPQGPEHLTAWLADVTLESWKWEESSNDSTARVTAFDLERRLLEFDTEIGRRAPRLAEAERELRNAADEPALRRLLELTLGPPRDLEVLERGLAKLPADIAVLAAFEGAQGELLLGATWTENGQTRQAVHVAKEATAARVALLLSEVQRVREKDPAAAGVRAAAWSELRKLLDVPLGAVLREVGARSLRVLAPHSLRGLPWLGLTASGEPLHTRLRGVALLPFLGFEDLHVLRRASAAPNTLCILGGTPERDEMFGAAVIATLRRCFPGTLVGEPATSPGTTITEAELIESRDREIQVLRFYGTGSPWALNASTEGLVLAHGRTLLLRNLEGVRLAACECVEMWAATEGGGALSRQAAGSDALPTLVRGFLTAGAGGVVDLAWPVHDLVKALVCERFAMLRRRAPMPPAQALALAVASVAKLLAEWRSAASTFGSVTDALRWIDLRRNEHLRRASLASDAVVPFAPLVEAEPPSSAMSFITACCEPVHLAAFRWWGA